ncbi:LacI family DNA-binding transcriptional regulator [Auraticoccus monumenti]|uniref:LacI family DNA-binding transcriptional regulator n=1 Tax=Auraticoccus monumenti TaxID=675864 RepID=UPI0018D2BFA7|nr:LacI family DNA-binding transcriptional regulator [Auraticoccus monumenti]
MTRRDVARAAGVSDAVVSYTLSGRAPVAPATAARVMAAIEELGYQPNQTARALKSGSTQTLALITPHGTNPFFAEFAHAIEAAATERGFALYTTTSAGQADTVRKRMREFAARQVDGVLLIPDTPVDPVQLDSVGIPWVLLNASVAREGVLSFGVDLQQGAMVATRHLIEDGRVRIAYLGNTTPGDERLVGWRRALAEASLAPGPAITAAFERDSGQRGVDELLAGELRPDALFVASDMLGVAVLRRLHERGVSIPGDIAVVSFDGSWESAYTWPALTTVRQPIEEMARQAVTQLLQLGHGRTGAPPRAGSPEDPVEPQPLTLLPGELIVRESCGPHPGTG